MRLTKEKEGGLEVAVYVFSLLVGYAPNGVDYAQGYRAKIFSKLSCPVRYLFAELPGRQDIGFYKKLGIPEEDMFSMYHSLLDHTTLRPTVKAKDKLAELMDSLQIADADHQGSEIRLVKEGRLSPRWYWCLMTGSIYCVCIILKRGSWNVRKIIQTRLPVRIIIRLRYRTMDFMPKGREGLIITEMVRWLMNRFLPEKNPGACFQMGEFSQRPD